MSISWEDVFSAQGNERFRAYVEIEESLLEEVKQILIKRGLPPHLIEEAIRKLQGTRALDSVVQSRLEEGNKKKNGFTPIIMWCDEV